VSNGRELHDLIPLAYEELRRVARQRMDRLRPGATLSPTDLVNEVLLRLLRQDGKAGKEYEGADHLIRTAAQAMHNVLVDRARRRLAAKRGGAQARRVDFDDNLPIAAPADDMLSFHEACETLRARSSEHHELLLLRIYAGMTNEQIAQQRGVSVRTIERQWRIVKAVMRAFLERADHGQED
jgi:RNA polymerase sigma factor (TIGR02999 family)